MSLARLGRVLTELPTAWKTNAVTRRKELVRKIADKLSSKVEDASKNGQNIPNYFSDVVRIPSADVEYFRERMTADRFARKCDIDQTQYKVTADTSKSIHPQTRDTMYHYQVRIHRLEDWPDVIN